MSLSQIKNDCQSCPLLKAVETSNRINSNEHLIELINNLQAKIISLEQELSNKPTLKQRRERLTISEMESIAFDIKTPNKEAGMILKQLLRSRNKSV